ncbi:MAG: Asp23/Gls24 family envelope stress response protein [Clostridia bacterium]|nr:Asp23/Gls24 family envelope stress response protein [Clostridia bacterium]
MSETKELQTVETNQGGKVVFAEDVIATIATLAASDVDGVYSMGGSAISGITEKLGKKSYTKGVKIEIGTSECAADMSLIIRYGYRIQDVCAEVQKAVKNAIETMTGLTVVEVNIMVQSVFFRPEKPAEPAKVEETPRVK